MTKKKQFGYVKGKFGIRENLTLLLSMVMFVLALMFGYLNNSAVGNRFIQLKQAEIDLPVEKIDELQSLSSIPNI